MPRRRAAALRTTSNVAAAEREGSRAIEAPHAAVAHSDETSSVRATAARSALPTPNHRSRALRWWKPRRGARRGEGSRSRGAVLGEHAPERPSGSEGVTTEGLLRSGAKQQALEPDTHRQAGP